MKRESLQLEKKRGFGSRRFWVQTGIEESGSYICPVCFTMNFGGILSPGKEDLGHNALILMSRPKDCFLQSRSVITVSILKGLTFVFGFDHSFKSRESIC